MDSKESMLMPLGLRIIQLGLELTNLTTPSYQSKILTGHTLYGDVHKILPDDMPEPLGKAVVTTTTMDANLNHCLATGKSLTGCDRIPTKKSLV